MVRALVGRHELVEKVDRRRRKIKVLGRRTLGVRLLILLHELVVLSLLLAVVLDRETQQLTLRALQLLARLLALLEKLVQCARIPVKPDAVDPAGNERREGLHSLLGRELLRHIGDEDRARLRQALMVVGEEELVASADKVVHLAAEHVEGEEGEDVHDDDVRGEALRVGVIVTNAEGRVRKGERGKSGGLTFPK